MAAMSKYASLKVSGWLLATSRQTPEQPSVLKVAPAQSPHSVRLMMMLEGTGQCEFGSQVGEEQKTHLCASKCSAMLHVSLGKNACGVPQLFVLIVPDPLLTSLGMLVAVRGQNLTLRC